ncbi:urease accessory protein UreD, partial [Mycena amicta]
MTGHGRISVELHGPDAVFTELSSAYPLKLLSPRVRRAGWAVAYVMTYGGGLVGGDSVVLSGEVGTGASLVLRSQGSTKVFKFRAGQRAASESGLARQEMEFSVQAGGTLLLLPEPVACFQDASYNQLQTFRVAGNGSLAVLDWLTSGRQSLGENWAFARYFSVNEIAVDGKRIAKDVLLLEGNMDKLRPYGCYATLFLLGPSMARVVEKLKEEYGRISVFRTSTPGALLWSLSGLGVDGAVVRLAGEREEIE